MPSTSRTPEKRIAALEAGLLAALRREIALTAEVHALRDYLRKYIEHYPIPEVALPDFEKTFRRSIDLHSDALLIQLEDANPAVSAFLSSLKDDGSTP